MIEILAEMERNSPYKRSGKARGDLGMLLRQLSRVAAGTDGRPRSLQAMRQAWWRWTTDGPQAATPPMQDLALMVRHAWNHGWLRQLKSPDCRSLVNKLMDEVTKKLASQPRVREADWDRTARISVEGLIDYLESRISDLADGKREAVVFPNPMFVQNEVQNMFTAVVERVLLSLDSPREVFENPCETDTILQPYEGWPAAFRELALTTSKILNNAAKEYEDLEATYFQPSYEASKDPRRLKLFPESSEEPEELEEPKLPEEQ